ncbi:MAG: MBL fold metallo-hydrolase [Patescibacteria group bacterium]|nr:MBL fold metallo-hydrolase [Patescibacteria group bacterium]
MIKKVASLLFYRWFLALMLLVILVIEMYMLLSVDGLLALHFLDVGQGDSCLIKTPGNKLVLVDAGEDESVLRELGETIPFWRNRVDMLVGTHADSDHIKGFVYVLENFDVGMVLINDLSVFDTSLDRIKEIAESNEIPIMEIEQGDNINIGELSIDVLWPPSEELDIFDDNQKSIVIQGEYSKFSFLLTGDIEIEQEERLISEKHINKVNILKLSHHGSRTATSSIFLDEIGPDAAIISCGLDNKFSHPNLEVIQALESKGITYYRTDQHGRISFKTDGIRYKKIVEK